MNRRQEYALGRRVLQSFTENFLGDALSMWKGFYFVTFCSAISTVIAVTALALNEKGNGHV